MILGGKRITAEEACQLGIVNQVVPVNSLMTMAKEWANQINEMDTLAIRSAKKDIIENLKTIRGTEAKNLSLEQGDNNVGSNNL